MFALAIEILITGPLVILFLYGIVPALAVRLIEDDVKRAFREKESLLRVGSTRGWEDLDRLKADSPDPPSATRMALAPSPGRAEDIDARRAQDPEEGDVTIKEVDL